MTASIYDVLDDLRATSLDERDKGDKFERLVQAYLKTDLEWAHRFSDVWLWSEWPGREGRPDTGIDLVAANRDAEDFTAIQCKFYAPGHKVAKADIDSFVSASARKEFTDRIVFDTAAGWSGNAEETLHGVAHRIDISYLTDAAIDWDAFSWHTPGVVVPTGKKALRPHQQRALDDVRAGLTTHDRGKLIMACGTGKTFTSLKIAEDFVGANGSVLFLVPSIQLLSQSLREWTANAEVDLRAFAVCSDVRVGRKQLQADEGDMATVDLAEPATTDAATLMARMRIGRHAANPRMTVVFSTYQSIDVIIEAQRQGLDEFDLVICDEAHRTTGVTLKGSDESAFVRAHDTTQLKAAKRLYMTATPRVFDDNVRRKATDAEAVLADMGDEATFGPELHRLGFGEAVEAGLLTDYKVLVLAVDESYVAENFQQAMSESGEMKLDEAAKLIGCWNGLVKNFGPDRTDGQTVNPAPMRTAVAFAQTINASKLATAAFPPIVDRALLDQPGDRPQLRVEARHVDGTMGIHDRNAHLAWLKETAPDDTCRILTNARCLSEGVDVPALDAVLFLTPRGSQVDVVQSVGRVMRLSPGKELGYIILPVVVPAGVTPEDALRDNERYRVVWQVLQALRSHDDRFHAMVNQIELNKKKPSRLEIVTVSGPTDTDRDGSNAPTDSGADPVQTFLEFPSDQFRDAMYARIVAKVGERRYWETWAKDVADIAAAHVTRINGLLADPASPAAVEFTRFLNGLRGNLNDNITPAEAVEMLAQHLVTRPIFQALFEDYDFGAHNPVAQTMERMLAVLDEHSLDAENETLQSFYASVRRRVAGVDNAEGKQRILVELYDKFFATAFKKTVDKLGIVYTPVEIVDFILRSADEVLRTEFGQGLTGEGVHILDGFTGTGTFLVRLMQTGLIQPHDLARKYAHELHGNEILLLAYYIAAVNIETTYQDLTDTTEPFPGLILTDTFQSWEHDDRLDYEVFRDNNARLEKLKALPIRVIVGNPPYSVGQDDANDRNQNERYPTLDGAIRDTYVAQSIAGLSRNMYDSYIRAIKWATQLITDRGVIAYVTNGGWLDSNSADGMRKSLADEFSAIYIYNLRGNQRTAGEQSRQEGGKIFGGGSRATVAITLLVRDTSKAGPATIHYADIGDYLTREQKLDTVRDAASLTGVKFTAMTPNQHGDWLNQRRDDFAGFVPIFSTDVPSVFGSAGAGLVTSRDAWAYSFSREAVDSNVKRLIDSYERERGAGRTVAENQDATQIGWSRGLRNRLARGQQIDFSPGSSRQATYRPFTLQWAYVDSLVNETHGPAVREFPLGLHNVGFVLPGVSSHAPASVLMADHLPDMHLLDTGHFFSRWHFERAQADDTLDINVGEVVNGYRRIDNITDQALKQFAATYPGETISKDDIFFYAYGILHSPEYRETYAADLKKMLPRIPFVEDFRDYAEAGRKLSDVHLGYESVTPYPLDGLGAAPPAGADAYDFYRVQKMRFPKKGERGSILYNDRITVSGVPDDAYRYMLGSRSAVEWIIDRYQVKTDKPSGIVNDPNDWSREVGDPRYILDLLARIVTVSVETMKIVDALPPLTVIACPLDRALVRAMIIG
ncbi:MAG: type ISP restriction/modification enzyme [Jatrophihabitantaceae bacterium]